ncbi:(deoxy)nucleoside triphosphate pyrophosphohydrolase [Marinoscillum sp.]|uniref:(deoxy)nucleoside triphosphate pyrophosphohydrolase n=1 Tax=Marinoscillum sp. TaxID=2024838 RepID=UPI003BAD8878
MIEVTCAVIIEEGRLLCAQRNEMDKHSLKWELPGGKVEVGESHAECLQRELREELDVVVEVNQQLSVNVHQYEHLSLRLIPFRCSILAGTPKPRVHQQLRWIALDHLLELDWAEADIPIIKRLITDRLS